VLAVLGAGCGDDEGDEAASSPADLTGVHWQVSGGLKTEGWEASAPTMLFDDAQNVSGSSGCNRYTASYALDGDTLQIGSPGTTLIGCEGVQQAVEVEFRRAMGEIKTWRIDGEELVLADADGKELLRLKEPTLTGRWEATGIRGPNAVSSPLAGTKVTAVFAADGTLTGNAGCNAYTTTYTRTRGGLTIAEPAATRKLCSEPDGVMKQEAAYLKALPLTRSYELAGAKLTLLTGEGTIVATFVPSQ
jgi:heat shock protein HslJ